MESKKHGGSQHNNSPTRPKDSTKKKKTLELDSEDEDLLSEQLDTFTTNASPSRQGGPEVPKHLEMKRVDKRKPLVMGKKPPVLATSLTPNENQQLQHMIKSFNKNLRIEIDEKYPDDYNRTIMMDNQVTAVKNVILRKIKYFK